MTRAGVGLLGGRLGGLVVGIGLALATGAGVTEAPVHHVLTVSLDPATRSLRGVDRVTLRDRRAAAFALWRGLTVERLVVDGRPVSPAGTGRFALSLDARPVHEVLVEYSGTVAVPAPSHRGAVAHPVIDAEGSFLPSDRWFPTFGGVFSYEVTIDVPDPQRAVTSGRLAAETSGPGRYRATFTSDAPVEELSLFAGPWRIAERIHRGWRLRTYFHPDVAELSDRYLERTATYLDLYDGWIGTYPYSGFAVVSGPLPVGLGFPGLTYLGTQVLRLPFIPDTSLGHEVLHSWWGAAVRPGAGGNWAEGLTTFMADYTFAERRGAEPARDLRLAWLREFAVLPAADDRPLTAFQGRSHTASQVTGYHKAAFVFLMLRDEIGADAFAAGVRRFWQAHRFAVAEWRDLEAAFARGAGIPVAGFFAQWVQRAGAPALAVDDVTADAARIAFTLRQADPPYALAVPVTVETAAGPATRAVRFDTTARAYAFEVTSAPSVLAVDPDLRLFRRLAREDVPPVLREAAFDPSTGAVIAAVDPAARTAAREVAARLLEREPAVVAAAAGALPARPLVVAGTTPEVTALLAATGLDGVPPVLSGRGTARAWAARRPDGLPLVVVAADGAEALRAAARPLPHYGAQSFVVFDGARAIERGLWPPAASPLRVSLEGATRSPR